MSRFRTSPFTEIATGLEYPEGPVWLSDGSLLIVEVKGGKLTRLAPGSDGAPTWQTVQSIALGGGPNGMAIGPNGAVYVCNNGGLNFLPLPIPVDGGTRTLNVPTTQPAGYVGGSVQRINLDTGKVETVFGNITNDPLGLRGPDDMAFDHTGGFWFTDWGKERPESRDITSVYYVPAGSIVPQAVLTNRSAPNGIALSPKGDRLYVAETYSRWVRFWNLDPAKTGHDAIQKAKTLDNSHLLTSAFPASGCLDSMALDEEGNLYVVTILPAGLDPMTNGGITVVSPAGEVLEFIEIDCGVPEPLPSNICFGGPDRRTLFITLGGTGRVVTCQMAIPGLEPTFSR
jgi:gluconolactonase